jgi:TM2 domain-containing membrane protein YozV
LCFFLGALGIHRFYLGYIGIGIIQLLTAGGCGIWVLIDFIRIIIGDLGPKDGSYSTRL